MSGEPKQPTCLAGGFKRPLKEAKFLLVTFFYLFSFFLIFYILPNFSLIQANRTYTISSAPKMVSPIVLLLKSRKILKSFITVLPFSIPITSDIDNLKRYRKDHMYMVLFYIHSSISIFLHLHSILMVCSTNSATTPFSILYL